MKNRALDPTRLDVAAFAAAGGELSGEWPLTALERLAEAVPAEAVDALGEKVTWQASGERRSARGEGLQTWLHLHAQARVALQCQRCLQPVQVPLQVDTSFRFVPDEATAEAIDADAEEDILVLTRSLDLRELAEDELVLALPVVALHEGACPEPLPLPAPAEDEAGEEERPNPFAALSALKRGPSN